MSSATKSSGAVGARPDDNGRTMPPDHGATPFQHWSGRPPSGFPPVGLGQICPLPSGGKSRGVSYSVRHTIQPIKASFSGTEDLLSTQVPLLPMTAGSLSDCRALANFETLVYIMYRASRSIFLLYNFHWQSANGHGKTRMRCFSPPPVRSSDGGLKDVGRLGLRHAY